MDGASDGHILTFGTVMGGVVLLLTSLVGGTIIALAIRSWNQEKLENSVDTKDQEKN